MGKLQFFGEREELNDYLGSIGLVGEWADKGSYQSFRARTGEIVNLYANGTIVAQGKNQERVKQALQSMCEGHIPAVAKPEETGKEKPQIFIVHGHDEAGRNELELVLRRLNLQPFILQNSSAGSKTIIEALEAGIYESSAFGIVLITPDDVGYSLRDGETAARPRARQNVVLEMGMVMAALSRKRMVILKKRGELELPSDTDGIVRLEYSTRVQEQVPGLVQHLLDAGIEVDTALIADASR
jgi:predicted nucleotide-binding protein